MESNTHLVPLGARRNPWRLFKEETIALNLKKHPHTLIVGNGETNTNLLETIYKFGQQSKSIECFLIAAEGNYPGLREFDKLASTPNEALSILEQTWNFIDTTLNYFKEKEIASFESLEYFPRRFLLIDDYSFLLESTATRKYFISLLKLIAYFGSLAGINLFITGAQEFSNDYEFVSPEGPFLERINLNSTMNIINS